jgi:hypothetical protein
MDPAQQSGGVQFGEIPAYCDRGDAELGGQLGHPEPAVTAQAPQDQLVTLRCKHAVLCDLRVIVCDHTIIPWL